MRILYLTQWFDPEPGVIKGGRFVRALEAAGHEISVVTAIPNYPHGRFYPGYRLRPVFRETIAGASVTRLPLYPSHDGSSWRRAINYLSFFGSVLLYCLFRRSRHDLIYVYHPPITVGLAAALATIFRPSPFVLEIQDLWPDTVAATGMNGSSAIARLLRPFCNFVYRRSSAIIVQSEGMRAALCERGAGPAKMNVVRNWADIEDLPKLRKTRRSGPFTIVYGGNFGRAQGLRTVIDAAALIEQRRSDIRIVLYGDGLDESVLRQRARELGLKSVEFRERLGRDAFIDVLAQADAALIHLARDPLFEITIPSKVQFQLAMGLPIIAGIAGEAAALLRESGAAAVAPPGDAEALAVAICELADLSPEKRCAMGCAGQYYYRKHLSFERGLASTLAVVAKAAPEAKRKSGKLAADLGLTT